MLTKAFGELTLSRARVFEWHKWFSLDSDSVEDDERTGHLRSQQLQTKTLPMLVMHLGVTKDLVCLQWRSRLSWIGELFHAF
ncbi:hypothetical protein TNCV_361751 [Trichonephila clavipes]|nr:hypothetical protein TNCV_361751 [Trichonephila clavipes]